MSACPSARRKLFFSRSNKKCYIYIYVNATFSPSHAEVLCICHQHVTEDEDLLRQQAVWGQKHCQGFFPPLLQMAEDERQLEFQSLLNLPNSLLSKQTDLENTANEQGLFQLWAEHTLAANPHWFYCPQESGCSLQLITSFIQRVNNIFLTASWLHTTFPTSFMDTVQMCTKQVRSCSQKKGVFSLQSLFSFNTSTLTS